LLAKLDRWCRQPLILVSAPAGYGKTTLLSTWLETLDRPSIWLTLDEHDSKLVVFLDYLLTAVRTRFPHACPEMEHLLASFQMPPSKVLANTLTNELDQIGQDYMLVLDDYHTIRDIAVHELLTEVLHHAPRSLHLVISTRRDPPLPLVNLRALSLMAEIRVQDLRFTTAEASALLQQVMGKQVDDATVATLVERTEGWITGLRLLAPSVHSQQSLQDISEGMQSSYQHVREYLITEVVARQPTAVQNFLLKTSILSRLCAPLADAVCCQDNDPATPLLGGGQHLEWLDAANLFLIPLDEEHRWFRYHHQLRQLLQHELERHCSPDELATLHLRASEWFAQNGFVDEALDHAWVSGDTTAAVRLVSQHRHEQMQRENGQRIAQWLRQFPREVIDSQPELLMAKAWTMYLRLQVTEMPPILDRIEELVAQLPPGSVIMRSLQGEIDTLRSYQCYLAGDSERGWAHAQRALESLPREWFYERGMALTHAAAIACQCLSDLPGAQAMLDRHLADIQLPTEVLLYLHLLTARYYLHWTSADLRNLLHVGSCVLRQAEQVDMPASIAWAHYYLGVSYYERNNLAEAERHLTAALERRHTAEGLVAAQSAFGLALTYQAQGQSQQALDTVDLITAYLLEAQLTDLLPTAQALHAELGCV
jgi:LuxR family maltose regulon positive regulatory protein